MVTLHDFFMRCVRSVPTNVGTRQEMVNEEGVEQEQGENMN